MFCKNYPHHLTRVRTLPDKQTKLCQ